MMATFLSSSATSRSKKERCSSARTQEEAIGDGGLQIVPSQLQAYREGSVGWVIDSESFRLPDGTEIPFRNTAIFHQEDGEWKLVHAHASIGARNEDVFGEDVTSY